MNRYMIIFLVLLVSNNPSHSKDIAQSELMNTIAVNLTDAGYSGLFLQGEHNLSDSIWQYGKNRPYLEQIVQSHQYSDLARILASEVLYQKAPGGSPEIRVIQ